MSPDQIGPLLLLAGGLGVLGYVLHKVGRSLIKLFEALAAIAVVFLTAWLALKGVWKAGRWVVRHWRTSVATVAVAAWWHWWGWPSLAITVATGMAALGVWRLAELTSFDMWAGRRLRSWWLRWTYYGHRMPGWLRACRLVVADSDQTVQVSVQLLRRTTMAPRQRPRRDQLPRITGVRSGPSWDEVEVKLVAGQTPEDFDVAARALAVARGVQRCQVRELAPDVVSIDFQRRDLLADAVSCQSLTAMIEVDASAVDLRRVWSGRTEYGVDWHQPLVGGHTLVVGSTGAGKNSYTWSPLVSIAPAIRAGLVRVSAIDPKGMELAYGRGVFSRYAVTARDALALLDELVAEMTARKTSHAGRVRTVDISTDCPLELIEFDEVAALTKYVGDRKLREQIIERVGLLNTQGRALGITVRGYVQEPNKDIIPIRDLFPRRICLRVPTKAHVAMALGDNAWDRGAWANRIGESTPGVGYLFGEGIREPLRVRAGWVPDDVIKQVEAFVTAPAIPQPTPAPELARVLPLPTPVTAPSGGTA